MGLGLSAQISALALLVGLSLPAAALGAPPPYQLYPNTSNVYGRAQVNRSAGVVRYIGRLGSTEACLAACLSFEDPADGAQCNSFSYHHADYPSADFAGACYAVADHSWLPVVDNDPTAPISSGRLAWPNQPCGDQAAPGCAWLADPVCLTPGNQLGPTTTLTTAEAERRCAGDGACVGWSYSGQRNQTGPVAVSFKNSSDEVKNGGIGCWSLRKLFEGAGDGYRTGFHFQPTANWMSALCSNLLYSHALCCTALYCAVLYCTLLHCTVLYFTALCAVRCTVLYWLPTSSPLAG